MLESPRPPAGRRGLDDFAEPRWTEEKVAKLGVPSDAAELPRTRTAAEAEQEVRKVQLKIPEIYVVAESKGPRTLH